MNEHNGVLLSLCSSSMRAASRDPGLAVIGDRAASLSPCSGPGGTQSPVLSSIFLLRSRMSESDSFFHIVEISRDRKKGRAKAHLNSTHILGLCNQLVIIVLCRIVQRGLISPAKLGGNAFGGKD